MKPLGWVLLIGGGIAAYLIWVANNAGGLQWIVQGVNIGLNGLTTDLDVTMIVQNPSSATITVTNMLVSGAYNGTVIGTGIVNATIPPGSGQVTVTIVMSDFSLLTNLINDIDNGNSGSIVTLIGKGTVNAVPGSFSTTYTLP